MRTGWADRQMVLFSSPVSIWGFGQGVGGSVGQGPCWPAEGLEVGRVWVLLANKQHCDDIGEEAARGTEIKAALRREPRRRGLRSRLHCRGRAGGAGSWGGGNLSSSLPDSSVPNCPLGPERVGTSQEQHSSAGVVAAPRLPRCSSWARASSELEAWHPLSLCGLGWGLVGERTRWEHSPLSQALP